MQSRSMSGLRTWQAAPIQVTGEGDLLSGAKNTYVATLVERRSRYVALVKLDGKDTDSVVSALIREVCDMPEGSMQTLTWDRGS